MKSRNGRNGGKHLPVVLSIMTAMLLCPRYVFASGYRLSYSRSSFDGDVNAMLLEMYGRMKAGILTLEILGIAAFLAECFIGWKIVKWTRLIIGGIVGGLIGAVIAEASNSSGSGALYVIVGILLGAVLGLLLFYVSVFLVGFAIGFAVYAAIFGDKSAVEVGLIFGLVFGVLAVILVKRFIILFTAIEGGFGAAYQIYLLVWFTKGKSIGWWWVIGILLAIAGFLVQSWLEKSHKEPARGGAYGGGRPSPYDRAPYSPRPDSRYSGSRPDEWRPADEYAGRRGAPGGYGDGARRAGDLSPWGPDKPDGAGRAPQNKKPAAGSSPAAGRNPMAGGRPAPGGAFCPRCGSQLNPGVRFCWKCGAETRRSR